MQNQNQNSIEKVRNNCLVNGDYSNACILQALHMKTLESRDHWYTNRKIYRQEYFILNDLVQMITSEGNQDILDLMLVLSGFALTGKMSRKYQKLCKKAATVFQKLWNRQADITLWILKDIAWKVRCVCSEEAANQYVDNVLSFIKDVYGYESRVYAQIYLHFLCECKYNDDLSYSNELTEKYQYFKKQLNGYDNSYIRFMFSYLYYLMERDEEQYRYWFKELSKDTETNKLCPDYPILARGLGYIRALEYENNNDWQSALRILKKIISAYIIPCADTNNLLCVYILYRAAMFCYASGDFKTMEFYAKKGIGICAALGEIETGLYFKINNYIGLKMLYDGKYLEAQAFYAQNCRKIKEEFGKCCENYINYVNNLGIAYLSDARMNDAMYCFEEADTIEGDEFEELKRQLIDRNIRWIMSNYEDSPAAIDRYVKKYLSESFLQSESNIKLEILWLMTRLRERKVDFDKINNIFQKISDRYKKNELPDHLKSDFEYCIIMYQWRMGDEYAALELSNGVVKRLGTAIYTYRCNNLAVIHIKLLIHNKNYVYARTFCEELLDYRYDEILEKGMGDITAELVSMRLAMLYYITMIDRYCHHLYDDSVFCQQLMERIVNCKTIEKDVLSSIGKYDTDDEEIHFKLYEFRNLRRKVNALEKRRSDIDHETSDECEKYRNDLNEKIFEYTAKLSELEYWLFQRIDFTKAVRKFKWEDVFLPEKAVAIEFFTYLNLDFDNAEINYDDIESTYICFAILPGSHGTTARYAGKLGSNECLIQEYYDCFINVKELPDDRPEIKSTINSFAAVLLPIIKPYIKGYETVYWGMDAEIHLIPVEWMLGEEFEDTINIHMDSIKYIRNDEMLDFDSMQSLIMGYPQYTVGENVAKKTRSLFCTEIECREIARIIGGMALLGKDATQQEFNQGFNSDIIHISTHGSTEHTSTVYLEKNRLKNSYILLSGYDDWIEGKKKEEYGNGILMADDISYANMKNTKLAVIAACLSGLSDVNPLLGNVYSLRWSLGVAGVHFSVTSLWNTDDVATSIFMVIFYRYLEKEPIGTAFHMAKNKLRNITREEIQGDPVLKNLFEQYGNAEECKDACPFKKDKYWAAFTCYCS